MPNCQDCTWSCKSNKTCKEFIDIKHIETIKRIAPQYTANYDATWLGINPDYAFLICIGAGPWKVKRRFKVQKTAINWFIQQNKLDLANVSLENVRDVYPFQWQNDHLYNMIKSLQDKGVTYKEILQRWKDEFDRKTWWTAHEELFAMCGVSKQGTKVLWLFIRDCLQLPAFPVDRWVCRNLQKHGLPPKAWYMTQACILADVNPNEFNRALFSGINPNFS